MFVYKRDGRREHVAFDKITSRINKLCYGLDGAFVDAAEVAQKVVRGVYQGKCAITQVTTRLNQVFGLLTQVFSLLTQVFGI